MNELSKKHTDSCRFCWMCRHICPIGNATGLERNTARARALGLSLVNRGAYGLEEVIDNVYECACCGACTKECVTGWDPLIFIREARLEAAMEGKLPTYIEKLLDACLETGNAYGKTDLDPALKEAIARHEKKEDALFFLGPDARFAAPAEAVKAIRAMEKTGTPFTVLADEPASGAQLFYLIGKADEMKQAMLACAEKLNGYAAVVAYDPQDAYMFKREFKENDVTLTAEAKTFTAFLAEKLDALKPEKKNKKAVFQDPFQLSRELLETEEGRKVAGAYLDLGEMLNHGKDTMWAGNILMGQWMPDVMEKVAKGRIFNAVSLGYDTIVTASVSEYVSLKNACGENFTVLSLEDLIIG